jgi:hypothetical protein
MEGWMVVWAIVLVPVIVLFVVAARSVRGRKDTRSRPSDGDVAETFHWMSRPGNPNGR